MSDRERRNGGRRKEAISSRSRLRRSSMATRRIDQASSAGMRIAERAPEDEGRGAGAAGERDREEPEIGDQRWAASRGSGPRRGGPS